MNTIVKIKNYTSKTEADMCIKAELTNIQSRIMLSIVLDKKPY